MPTCDGRTGRPGRLLRRMAIAVCALLGPLAMAWSPDTLAQADLPDGFSETVVSTDIDLPTALAAIPSGPLAGDIYVTAKDGTLFLVPGSGGGSAMTALDLSPITCSQGERGLLGVALDPAFARNSRVYVYVTEKRGDACVNRVSRFAANDDGTLDPGSRKRLLSTAPLGPTNHNGGDIQFGADGFLYVAIGENAKPNLAQARNTLFGKIVRITTDGAAPSSNPFAGRGTSARCAGKGRTTAKRRCAEIYALGLRNPFRLAFEDDTNRFFINDVGQNAWEEIDRGARGANYGWPEREGPCPQGTFGPACAATNRFADPVFAYKHATGCRTITGGAFVPGDAGWGNLAGAYLYADFICGKLFVLSNPFAAQPPSSAFATGLGEVVALQFDPANAGELLYTTFDNGGEVRRITP